MFGTGQRNPGRWLGATGRTELNQFLEKRPMSSNAPQLKRQAADDARDELLKNLFSVTDHLPDAQDEMEILLREICHALMIAPVNEYRLPAPIFDSLRRLRRELEWARFAADQAWKIA
jgi:hypothetical protein